MAIGANDAAAVTAFNRFGLGARMGGVSEPLATQKMLNEVEENMAKKNCDSKGRVWAERICFRFPK